MLSIEITDKHGSGRQSSSEFDNSHNFIAEQQKKLADTGQNLFKLSNSVVVDSTHAYGADLTSIMQTKTDVLGKEKLKKNANLHKHIIALTFKEGFEKGAKENLAAR